MNTYSMYFNLTRLKRITNGNAEVALKIIDYYQKTTPVNLQLIEQGVQAGKWKNLASLAHEVLNTVSAIGMEEMKEPMRIIEDFSLSQQKISGLELQVLAVTQLYANSLDELESIKTYLVALRDQQPRRSKRYAAIWERD